MTVVDRLGLSIGEANPYYATLLVLGFLLVPVSQDLGVTYGVTGASSPYVSAIPFLGVCCSILIGVAFAIRSRKTPETAAVHSFAPLYSSGVIGWLAVTATVSAYTGETSTTVAAVGGAIVVLLTARVTGVSVSTPTEVTGVAASWPRVVVASSVAPVALVGGVYAGYLPDSATIYAFVLYGLTTLCFPYALFLEGYRRGKQDDRKTAFVVKVGTLGVLGLVTLGVTNFAVALGYLAWEYASLR